MTEPASPPLTGRRSAFGSLRHRNFRLFISGQFVSLCGTWIQNVAQGWLVYQLSNSAFAVGLVSTLGTLPVLAFTLYGGAVADRVNKHRWILLLQSLMVVPVLGLAVLVQLNRASVTAVAIAALVLGVLNAFEVPARQAFVVDMAGREDLMSAIALNSSIFNLSRIIGPAIAGILITTVGIAACFYVNAASFVAVVAGLLMMRMPAAAPPDPSTRTGQLWGGLQWVISEPWPRAMVIITGTLSVFGYAFIPMLPVFASEALGSDAAGFGGLVSGVGVGAFMAAIVVAWLGPRLPRRRTVIAAGMGLGVSLILAGLAGAFWVALLLFVAAGTAMVMNNVMTNTQLQTSAPDHLRGRVMGVYSFLILGLSPLGSFQTGWVAERLGVRTAIALGGAICLLVTGVVGWVERNRVRAEDRRTVVGLAG